MRRVGHEEYHSRVEGIAPSYRDGPGGCYGGLARTRVVVGGRGDAKYYSGVLLDLVKL